MSTERELLNAKQEPMEMEDQVEDPEDLEEEGEAEDVENPDDWEEVTMVVTVNGILDAELVREAVQEDLINLRYAETDAPVLQIKNSLYTAHWNQDLGTNLVLQAKGREMEVISCTSTTLSAEKALLTSVSSEGSSALAQRVDTAPKASLSRTQPRGK